VFLASGVPTLVLQAGVVIGSGSASFEMIRHLTEVLPYMPAPKWVRNFIQPIAVRDVMHYLLGAARVAADVNRAVDIGGPDVLRYGQMMNGYAVEAGLPQRPIAPFRCSRRAGVALGERRHTGAALDRPPAHRLTAERVRHGRPRHRRHHPAARGWSHALSSGRGAGPGSRRGRQVETSWQDAEVSGVPSDPLPSDPDWSGRTVFTDVRTATTTASPRGSGRSSRGSAARTAGTPRPCCGRCAAGWTGSSEA
jgi:hypothetical protein